MKINRFLLLATGLFFHLTGFGQKDQIQLRTGRVNTTPLTAQAVDSFNRNAVRYQQKTFTLLQFNDIPSAETRKTLEARGIVLLDYVSANTYSATIQGSADLAILERAGAKGLVALQPRQKMEPRLASGILPSSAITTAGTINVWISFPKTFTGIEVMSNLRQLNMDVVSTDLVSYRILSLRIAANRLYDLAALPFVEYVQATPAPDQPLNFNSRYVSRANLLNASLANGGRGLNGEGVVVGIGDNADIQNHIDFRGRLINRAPESTASAHGHHTAGTLAGAGNGNELYRGYAPKASIITQGFNGIILNAAAYVNDYNMVITNNSYGDNIECSYFGTYDLYSRLLDQMAIDLPNLENVFSAGNSGTTDCAPFLSTYHNVLGGYQSAKNVITVGATTDSGMIASFSSRGPVRDGRLKPEVVAMGQFVASAWPSVNNYSYNNGTSMSCPAVAGGLTLLYQRYRQLHGGADPKNGLMKAFVCNGAQDRGNTGPDYQYGYGWLNLVRSVDMMENNRYFISSVSNNAANTHTISVPANTAQLKVMLYWNDPAASMLSTHTLVNDLDLEVSDPAASTKLPGILDTSNAHLADASVTGADHLNNVEQVVINNPASGNYSLKVKGTAVAQNPQQEYFLVYDILPVQLKITAPAGGEGLAPSTVQYDMMKISWEAYGLGSGTATIEFSADNGASWTTLSSTVNINSNIFTWWVPNVATSQALVRITKNGTGETSTSNPFTIVGLPLVSLAANQCEGYININWTAISGATDYEVMMLKGDDMKPVATTTSTNYTFSGLSKDSVYWVTVRARVNGKPGRRAVAISRQPNNGSCTGAISDNDLKIDAILAPASGRKFTSSQLGAASVISVRIKNLDDAPVNDFDLKYSINGGSFVSEHVSSTIAAGASFTYNFGTTADLSAPGNYNLVVVVKNSITDPVTINDSAYKLVKQLDNQPLNLTSYFVDNIETALPSMYQKDTLGLDGLERYDFTPGTIYGRLRTFVNSGMAFSGNRALTLDADRFYNPGNTNYLYGTFNLSSYDAVANDVRLDFRFNQHGQVANPANRVWIRGNETQPWVLVYNLDAAQADPGYYQKSSSIELSDLLAANGQNFGTSFQVRWGQYGQIAATDLQNAAGYSFDDIRVYQVFNDMQLLSIDAPITNSCGLTNSNTIKVSVRNSANTTLTNIPVRYRIDNGSWITETISSIAANTTLQYSFTTPSDLSALGNHTITALVDLGADSFRDNDTAIAQVMNTPVISSFPHLQNFESGNGYWYPGGKHSTWEYGTPASVKINRAASGAKAWKTRLTGNYNDNEASFLYSPCYDISGLTNPTLSFSVALDIEDCDAQLCDGAWVEYSADGLSWTKLGASGAGTNWYNKSADQLWSIQNYTNWHVATIPLPTGISRLRLRFVMAADQAANREGIAIDDIHVYDNTSGIYDGSTMAAPVSQTVSGNGWIDFKSSGKLVASVQPNNQTLGTTDVQAYINTAAVRYTNSQYYHDRNITIKPANTLLADSVSVRFYFLDTESDTLIRATGCASCSRPSSAYDLGVSKYSDPDDAFENGTIGDDIQGTWKFIPPSSISLVPFDKGYYAEFKVKDFSEFWLNTGGFDQSSPLPVKLMDFTAQRSGNDVLLNWKVGSETDVEGYVLELARGSAELQSGHFVQIGNVASQGNTTSNRNYNFTDTEADKFGPRYYRLKVVNLDGSYFYSPIRAVLFNEAVLWQVYPNPSTGLFSLVYQLGNNEEMNANILDAKGSLVKEYHRRANGQTQKLSVDLTGFPSGVYLLQIHSGGGKKQSFKLYKH